MDIANNFIKYWLRLKKKKKKQFPSTSNIFLRVFHKFKLSVGIHTCEQLFGYDLPSKVTSLEPVL